jgi:CelD/BcsL family acetyltransferase involved in cellulose biosynthesis
MMVADAPRTIPQTSFNPGFTVTVFDSFEKCEVTREEWDLFVLDVEGSLYVTYDWCSIWWRYYGGSRHLRLFIFREGGRLVGLAPMFIEYLWLGLAGLKIAKRVGADFALTMFALPLAPEHAEVAYRKLIEALIKGEECDAVWFGFMPGNDPTTTDLRDACQSLQGAAIVARDAPAGPHTLFSLPTSFKSYLASLDKRQRQNYRRDINLLNKNFDIRGDIVRDPSQALAAFASFKAMHASQWKVQRKLGHFGDWPDSELFNADLVSAMSRLGRFRLIRLFADQNVVASQYAFVFGDCCYWRLPARAVTDGLDRFGLGRVGLLQLIETMIEEGMRRIEAGVGHYEYKLRLGGEELMVRSILVVADRYGSAVRARLFLAFSYVLHLVYYRIWFGRIAPHLPWAPRPLWRFWVRLRL